MLTYKIHVLRAGSASTETPHRYIGQLDRALSPEGADELRSLCGEYRYPRVEMVYTSPLLRCRQTADILYPDTYAEVAGGLREMGLGRFEGRSFAELSADPDFSAWLQNSAANPPPGGERPAVFLERVVRAFRDIFERMMAQGMRSVAVLTHGGVIMSLLAGACLPKREMHQWACRHGAGYTLLFTPQMWMRDGCAEVYRAIPEPYGDGAGDDFLEPFA